MKILGMNNQRCLVSEGCVLLLLSYIRYASSANCGVFGNGGVRNEIAFPENCGGFRYANTSGEITSPNYPEPYPANVRCIWVFEAAESHHVVLNINAFEGQETNTSAKYHCNDYIEVRDGSTSSNLLLTSCGSLTSHQINSTARWLWILFSSDDSVAASGLTATFTSVKAGVNIDNTPTPLKACRTHEFSCSNKQCISNSYRCDGYFDCGCADGGCDEDGCGGFGLSCNERLGIGIAAGLGVFTLIVVVIVLVDRRQYWIRHHKY